MKFKLMILMALLCTQQYTSAQEIWVQRDSVKGPGKASCISFQAYGIGFIGLGRNFDGDKRSLYSYDRLQDDWDKEESLGGDFGNGLDRSSAVAFTLYNRAYIGTGKATAPFLDDFWEYNPFTDTWAQKANFGGTPRRQAVAFGMDTLGYVGTGEDISGFTNDFWSYSPVSNQWTEVAPFPGAPRKQAIGVRMGAHGYVGTGYDGTYLNDFWSYDPDADFWTQKNDFGGTPRYGAATYAVFPNLFIVTGYDNTLSYKKDVWKYSYFGDTWEQKGDFPGPARVNATAFTIFNKGFLGTGYNGQYLDDFYEYQFVLSTDENAAPQIKTFPNPATDQFTIEVGNARNLQLGLYTLDGRDVTDKVSVQFTANSIRVSCEALATGTYIYSLSDGQETIGSDKIILSR